MAEVLFWQSNGYHNSIGSALFIAAQLKSQGVDVAVVFVAEALAALAERKFEPCPALAKYATTIEENMKKMGFPTNAIDYVKQAKSAGIPLYAAGIWSDLLGVRGKLPAEIQVMENPDVVKLIAEAKKIIGGP
jgi:peroxiredoxin family protein